jgi:hypothetical protein
MSLETIQGEIPLGNTTQFLDEQTLPEPFLARLRSPQRHALQVWPDA